MTVSVGGTEFGTGVRTQRIITYQSGWYSEWYCFREHGLRNPQEGSSFTFGEVAPQASSSATVHGIRP